MKTWSDDDEIEAPGTLEQLERRPGGVRLESLQNGFRVEISMRSSAWLFYLIPACVVSAFLGFFSRPILQANDAGRWIFFLFLIPFYAAAAGLWAAVFYFLFGKVFVEVEGNAGRIFAGVRSIGWTRRFDWSAVEKVYLSKHYRTNWRTLEQLAIEGNGVVLVGRGARGDRLRFMLAALRARLSSKEEEERHD